jgi:hypothetical protein
MWYVARASGGGNVVAYNYMDDRTSLLPLSNWSSACRNGNSKNASRDWGGKNLARGPKIPKFRSPETRGLRPNSRKCRRFSHIGEMSWPRPRWLAGARGFEPSNGAIKIRSTSSRLTSSRRQSSSCVVEANARTFRCEQSPRVVANFVPLCARPISNQNDRLSIASSRVNSAEMKAARSPHFEAGGKRRRASAGAEGAHRGVPAGASA